MLLLASDYVGSEVVKFLAGKQYPIVALALDNKDPGGFNSNIQKTFEETYPNKPIFSHEELSDEKNKEKIFALKPTIGVLAWWFYILKEPFLSLPKKGWINFHPSYLPYNKGRHSSFWCLAEETPCGVSLHKVTAGIDAGAILAQEKIKTSWEDTGESVFLKSKERILDLFKKSFDKLVSDTLTPSPNTASEGTFHKSNEMRAALEIHLDREYSGRKLLNFLRASMFSGFPSAYFSEDGKKYQVKISIKEESD